jgi:hypothetical protein
MEDVILQGETVNNQDSIAGLFRDLRIGEEGLLTVLVDNEEIPVGPRELENVLKEKSQSGDEGYHALRRFVPDATTVRDRQVKVNLKPPFVQVHTEMDQTGHTEPPRITRNDGTTYSFEAARFAPNGFFELRTYVDRPGEVRDQEELTVSQLRGELADIIKANTWTEKKIFPGVKITQSQS